jgi:hypothetical protein
MAIIYSYPETTDLLPTDMLVGTSTIRVAGKKKNITKNFTLDALRGFILQGYSTVTWGSITGILSNQTDLQAALNAKQGNITLTTTGSTGAATLIGNTLNIPNYASGIVTPTLNQVLTVGNVSLLDAKVGNLYSYDTVNADYGIVQFYDSGVSLKAATTNNLLFFNDDTGTVSFSNGIYDPILNFAGVGNNVYTFQNANGTLAFLSDIPSVSGYVPTSRTLTINGTSYDLTSDRSWSVGTVTSVGLSMPSAFTVSSSPVTGAGTIAVTGAGTASQYIRGDGTLATLPSGGGGGSSVNYYLNGSVNASVATYKQLSNTAIIGAGTNFILVGNGLISQFLTDVGNPNRLEIPGGAWNFEMFFSMSSNGGTPAFYVELLKYDGVTFTSIASSSAVPENITGGTSIDLYLTSLAVPTTPLLVTDRLAIRVYIVNNSGGRTATLHTEDNHLCEIITTFSGGVTSLNGLTANTQYLAVGTSGLDFSILSAGDTHTFNLPSASSMNRGALNSADWITFNNKFTLPSLTSGSVLFSNGTTIAQDNANFFWDDTNNRLGIGTTSPLTKLHIEGDASSTTDETVLTLKGNGENGKRIEFRNAFGSLSRITGTKLAGGSSGDEGILTFETATNSVLSEKMRITNTGNVGIGITAPLTELHVAATTDTEIRASENTNNNYISLYQQAANSYLIAGGPSSSPLMIYTGASERMRITGAGNVGIGTTAPANRLTVLNSASPAAAIIGGGTSTPAWLGIGTLDSGTVPFIQGYNNLQTLTTNMAINPSGGNVGIGITTPEVKLDVYGSGTVQSRVRSASGGDIRFSADTFGRVGTYSTSDLALLTSGTEKVRITTTGNVGIGTTAPLKILTTSSTDATTGLSNARTSVIRVNNTSTVIGTFSGIAFGRNNANTQTTAMIGEILQDVSSTWASDMVFGVKASVTATDVTEYMRIKYGGNVGIGTTAPTSKLQVVGLPSYLDNAAAIAGGLTVGAFYHTMGVVKVVI